MVGITWRDGREGVSPSYCEGVRRSCCPCPQPRLHFTPTQFDRGEVRRIARQGAERGMGGFNRFPNASHLMGFEMIHQHDLPGA
jgi:hypothetical protein